MNDSGNKLQRLLALARKARAPAPVPAEAPWGFAARVAARWKSAEGRRLPALSLWERACWWGAAASLIVCTATAIHHARQPQPSAFDPLVYAAPANPEPF